MSFFSIALDSLIHERQLTQGQLAEISGINQAQISRYLTASARPDTEYLGRLCAAFNADGTSLLIAFLRDEIPPALCDALEIRPASKKSRDDSARHTPYDRLPRKVRTLLDEIATACERDPRIFAAIESTMSLVRKNHE